MEILFVSHKYPPVIGGMEKQSFELINGMKDFATVHAIVYKGDESLPKFFLSLEQRIVDMCKQFPHISLIHYNDALIASFCLRHKRYKHLRRAVTVHGLDVVFPNQIYQKRILPAFNRFDLIIAVSDATAKACIARGIDARKVHTVVNGVDHSLSDVQPDPAFLDAFQKKYGLDLEGKVIMTALGRPVRRKGFSWFLQNVQPQLKGNYILLIIGPFNPEKTWKERLIALLPNTLGDQLALATGFPTDAEPVRKWLKQNNDRSKVAHLGKLPGDELTQILAASNALLMPNIAVEGDMEGFGLVALEASLAGSWVFASGIDGITDAIHHEKNGTLLPAGDPAQWIAAINKLIANPADFSQEQKPGRAYTMAHFGWDKMVRRYLQLFESAHQH